MTVAAAAFVPWTTTTTTTTTQSTGQYLLQQLHRNSLTTTTRQRKRKNHHNLVTTTTAFTRPSRLLASTSTTDTTDSSTTSSNSNTSPSSSSSSSSSTSSSSSLKWTTDRVRNTFIDYFTTRHNHTFQPSSLCIPSLDDPTLLFTNAGMNQFKSIFLGQVNPKSSLALLQRAVNSQKCIRAGGKHNDLDDVGHDTYHHTFFEMLGTWSFHGNYNKSLAIEMAWDLLIHIYELNPQCIYATYFEGNDIVPADLESRDLWLQYLPNNHVLPCTAKDNFWEMGDIGPCGPCTEIHYDRRPSIDDKKNNNAAQLVNADDPNVIEIWNLVFIQYNRDYVMDNKNKNNNNKNDVSSKTTTLQLLPAQHIDTGMGLERLVSILQNQTSNYDIDCFQPLLEQLSTLTTNPTQIGPYTGLIGKHDVNYKDTAYRVIVDHVRTITFALTDGVIPNNEGRGYVLRRIIRRAIRYGQEILKCKPGFLCQLIPTVIQTFGTTYPELKQEETNILDIVQEEEVSFNLLLHRGLKYFDELKQDKIRKKKKKKTTQTTTTTTTKDDKTNDNAIATSSATTGDNDNDDDNDEQQQQQQQQPMEITGQEAFFMYDTLGFPLDLTQLMAEEAGMTVNVQDFTIAMQEQKDRSRQAQKMSRGRRSSGGTTNTESESSSSSSSSSRRRSSTSVWDVGELQAEETAWLQGGQVPPTDDSAKYIWDVPIMATIQAIYTTQGTFVDNNNNNNDDDSNSNNNNNNIVVGDYMGLILDKTTFYAEAGGQEADTGVIELLLVHDDDDDDNNNNNNKEDMVVLGTFVVSDVQVYAGYVVHKGQWMGRQSDTDNDDDHDNKNNKHQSPKLAVGGRVMCRVDYDRRRLIAPNHSMTHVLNAALNQILGDDTNNKKSKIDQRGSLCNEEKLRFDFTHKKALTISELQQVQDYCQHVIATNQPVTSQVLPLSQAQAIRGVRAVFGEVYPDPVRVITIGKKNKDNDDEEDDNDNNNKDNVMTAASIEFCGGTHITNTKEAQAFCLIEETAVAKGIRRISAVTKEAAIQALAEGTNLSTRVQVLEEQVQHKNEQEQPQAATAATTTTTVAADETSSVALRKDLDVAIISASLKAELRHRIHVVQNQIFQMKKQALQQRVDIVLNQLKVQVEEAVTAGESTLVALVDIGADSKASQRIRNAVQEWAPQLAFMGLSLEDKEEEEEEGHGGKLLAFAIVPKDKEIMMMNDTTLKANEWILAALKPCNGKGGGKPDNAQGQAPECFNIHEVVMAAKAHVKQ